MTQLTTIITLLVAFQVKHFVADYPLTIRHQDGKLTDVLYNASVYKDAAGSVLGVFAAARDVTTQKQASQYARSLIEASLDALQQHLGVLIGTMKAPGPPITQSSK